MSAGACRVIIASTMPVHEHDLNQAIARALHSMRRGWSVSAEETGVMRAAGKRPDIVVRRGGRPAVLIENEFHPASNAEEEAAGRLGQEFAEGGKARIVIAMNSPAFLRESAHDKLDGQVKEAEFKYALLSGAENAVRFPESGWLAGDLADLAGFVYRASVPAEAVQAAAISLEGGVQSASKILEESDRTYESTGEAIQKILKQEYNEQTRRMAVAILVNAMSFQNHLAGYKGILSIGECRGPYGEKIRSSAIGDEWGKILSINYWPIFEVARDILRAINPQTAQRVVDRLASTVKAMSEDALLLSHDLFGRVFQRLIADRKFLATFYTRPPSAALLANLAIPEEAPFAGGNWRSDAKSYIVADFACGTGALLTAAYQRVSELHERAGGDAFQIHPDMMTRALVGCDVMPAAAHLTASILSGAHPNREFDRTQIYTMPYGEPKKGEFRIGSLELLDKQSFLPVISTSAQQERGKGRGKKELREIEWRSAHLVIMNPPFTRPTNHEGEHRKIPNPAFAAFCAPAELQNQLGERSKELRKKTCGSGNAGIASDFTALANKMVSPGGIVALVLPLSAMAGESWKGAREMWASQYEDIRVVTLSAPRIQDCAFSADTGMGEVLFIGRRRNGVPLPPAKRRGIFHRPEQASGKRNRGRRNCAHYPPRDSRTNPEIGGRPGDGGNALGGGQVQCGRDAGRSVARIFGRAVGSRPNTGFFSRAGRAHARRRAPVFPGRIEKRGASPDPSVFRLCRARLHRARHQRQRARGENSRPFRHLADSPRSPADSPVLVGAQSGGRNAHAGEARQRRAGAKRNARTRGGGLGLRQPGPSQRRFSIQRPAAGGGNDGKADHWRPSVAEHSA